MAHKLYAHTADGEQPWQGLIEHLNGVAELAGRFAAKFGAESAGWILGMTHDLAKANPAFQDYLHKCAAGQRPQKVPHAHPSAAAVPGLLEDLIPCVQGHHTRLPDAMKSEAILLDQDDDAVLAARELARSLGLAVDQSSWPADAGTKTEMFVRMCFSCLIDADRLDSATHSHPNAERVAYLSVGEYLDKLRHRIEDFPLDDRPVNRVRREVQEACVESARRSPGFFRLTVPTGGGKTLASLRFALEHAQRHKQERVIVAIPYTSIIEQTASIYAKIFGSENVLEHHSAAYLPEKEDEDEESFFRRLAPENWDVPLTVTTNVRLFESLLGNTPASCRRIHNLANAVIVLDEPQTLPVDLLEPCLDTLAWLVENANTTVVFCTATQPEYSALERLPEIIGNSAEIVSPALNHFDRLKRVSYRPLGVLSHSKVANRMTGSDQVLCIVNSRHDSLEIFKALDDPNSLYISTLLCGSHRSNILSEIRERLAANEQCRVVSTQVLECGCDVDFPYVMRAMGPLESLVQAAGRCNREGRMPNLGTMEIFELEEGRMPQGAYATAYGIAKRFVASRHEEMDSPKMHSDYFSALFGGTSTDRGIGGSDGRKTATIQMAREALDFETVAREAKLIKDDTVSVIAHGFAASAIDSLLNSFLPPKKLFRKLGPYSISLRVKEASKHQRNGLIREHPCGALIWTGPYSEKIGIAADVVADPSDLIA